MTTELLYFPTTPYFLFLRSLLEAETGQVLVVLSVPGNPGLAENDHGRCSSAAQTNHVAIAFAIST